MRRLRRYLLLAIITLVMVCIPSRKVSSQVGPSALVGCKEIAFSVEQDFRTNGPLPPDGDPILSDGDLLGLIPIIGGYQGTVCARNADLLSGFDVNQDLGLDAVDVLDTDAYIVAFSTELNSPAMGQFTAGDLLVTNDAIIPNRALTFIHGGIGYDIGLDGLHFVGEIQDILAFLQYASQVNREAWLTDLPMLANELDARNIDIWFSVEGTIPGLLDGDLLSARTGLVVARNDEILPPTVPAGIPVQGIDYGLDGITGERIHNLEMIHFSTELGFAGAPQFQEGDVLKIGDGVVLRLNDMLDPFEPAAATLGLDALYIDIHAYPTFDLFLPLIMKGTP